MDICVTDEMDMLVTDDGDIKLTTAATTAEQLAQEIKTSLLWIHEEWRLGPELGFPWFEDVLVKKPDFEMIMQQIRNTILDIDEVDDCSVQLLSFDEAARRVKFEFHVTAGNDIDIREEVVFDG